MPARRQPPASPLGPLSILAGQGTDPLGRLYRRERGLPEWILLYTRDGRCFFRIDRNPDIRGFYGGVSGGFQGVGNLGSPKRSLLFDATFIFYGGAILNHNPEREVLKNTLFTDFSVRAVGADKWRYN